MLNWPAIIEGAVTALLIAGIAYIIKWHFGKITTMWQGTQSDIKEIKAGQERAKETDKVLLRDRLIQQYDFFHRLGAVTVEDMDNHDEMYKQYEAVGGNGTIKEIHKRFKKLPIIRTEEMVELKKEKGIK